MRNVYKRKVNMLKNIYNISKGGRFEYCGEVW